MSSSKQPLIDTHHHLWALDGHIHYDWLTTPPFYNDFLGDYSAICRPFLCKDLYSQVPSQYKLLASVHCEAECRRSDWLKEVAWIDQTAKHCWSSNKVAMVQSIWVDLFDSNLDATLSDIKNTYPSVRGIRCKPDLACIDQTPKSYLQQWHKTLTIFSNHQMLWELRLPDSYLPWAYELLKNHQELTVVINHCGLPWDRSQKGILAWQKSLEKLSSLPNIYIKLSELKAPNQLWRFDENLMLLERLLDTFDPSKAMFASNAPVGGVNCSYGDWLGLVETSIAKQSDKIRQAILWQTAKRVYNISLNNKLNRS